MCTHILVSDSSVDTQSACRQFRDLFRFTPPPHQSVLEPEAPPLLVVVLLGDASIEDPPAPLVDEVAEGDKGDLVEGHLHEKVDVIFCQGKERKNTASGSYRLLIGGGGAISYKVQLG